MSALPSRRDAEDIANGTPLSGPERLVDRIQVAIGDKRDAYQEGYQQAIKDMFGKLEWLAEDASSSTD